MTKDFDKGFSVRNLRQMRQFHFVYSILQTLSAELQIPRCFSTFRKTYFSIISSLNSSGPMNLRDAISKRPRTALHNF